MTLCLHLATHVAQAHPLPTVTCGWAEHSWNVWQAGSLTTPQGESVLGKLHLGKGLRAQNSQSLDPTMTIRSPTDTVPPVRKPAGRLKGWNHQVILYSAISG